MLKKIQYMLNYISKKLIIVFIDYFAIVNIAKQIKLLCSFINRINLQLICVSQYILQFFINIK